MYILWIRHGFSCANYIKATDNLYLLKMMLEPDAHLTNLGREQTNLVAKDIFKAVKDKDKGIRILNFLFTSILTRTIQTANALNEGLNKQLPIIVLPYIEEIPLSVLFPIDRQNQPRNIEKIRNDTKIKIEVIDDPILNPYNEKGEPIKRVNIDKFYELILPNLIEMLKGEGYKITDKTAVVIVSHRKTIKQATGINLGNTGAVLQKVDITYDDDDDNYFAGDIEIGESQLIFEGFLREESAEIVDEYDISNCKFNKASRN